MNEVPHLIAHNISELIFKNAKEKLSRFLLFRQRLAMPG